MANRLIPDAELAYWGTKVSRSIRPRLVRVLLERDGSACGICGALLGDDQVIDHIIPNGKGYSGEQWNLRVVHSLCNHFNNTQPLAERLEVAAANRHAIGDLRTVDEIFLDTQATVRRLNAARREKLAHLDAQRTPKKKRSRTRKGS